MKGHVRGTWSALEVQCVTVPYPTRLVYVPPKNDLEVQVEVQLKYNWTSRFVWKFRETPIYYVDRRVSQTSTSSWSFRFNCETVCKWRIGNDFILKKWAQNESTSKREILPKLVWLNAKKILRNVGLRFWPIWWPNENPGRKRIKIRLRKVLRKIPLLLPFHGILLLLPLHQKNKKWL